MPEEQFERAQQLIRHEAHARTFADCLIGARYGTLGCSASATFDSDALKLRGYVAA